MVEYGYILPKKNINARLEALQEGLKNQNIKNLNAKANLNMYSPLTISGNVPTITQQTGQTQAIPSQTENKKSSAQFINATVPLNLMLKEKNLMLKEKKEIAQTVSDLTKQVERNIQPKSLIDELKQKIAGRENIEFPMPEIDYSKNNMWVSLINELKQKISNRENIQLPLAEIYYNKKKEEKKKEEGLTLFDIKNIKKKISDLLDQIDTEKEMQDTLVGLINSPMIEGEENKQTKAVLYDIINNVVQNNELASMALNDINIPIPLPVAFETVPEIKRKKSDTSSLASTWVSSTMSNFNDLQDGEKQAVNYQEGFKNIKTEEQFLNYLNKFKNKKFAINLSSKISSNPYFAIPSKTKKIIKLAPKTSDNTLKTSYEYFKNNKTEFDDKLKSYIQKEFGIMGSGLIGGKVKSHYYSSYSPNFGNLHLMENSLKKNQLTIYRPYSKIVVTSKSSITPLLKKMIFDIQNTLEFDQRDYQNLDSDEKRVIERIIRSQKNMKNYNIQALIDEDDAKIKKRLNILVGQINAGNASLLVKQEMKVLLKKLYDNKAISLNKYRSSLNAIKALG